MADDRTATPGIRKEGDNWLVDDGPAPIHIGRPAAGAIETFLSTERPNPHGRSQSGPMISTIQAVVPMALTKKAARRSPVRRLRHVSSDELTIQRVRHGRGFGYRDADGRLGAHGQDGAQ